jgi:nitric oxide reductase activation protein
MITNGLTKQIKEIKTYNTGGKQNGLLVGKLDKKNLWKYKTDPHIFCNNSYKLKEMDLAFGCILDESGSMYGEKIKNGRIVMIMLHEVLNSLGINHSIIGHTSSGMHNTIVYKYYQFKEEAHHSLDKPYGLAKADSRSGNCDSGALYYMQSVLKQVHNKDKIVIIFSDGEPTECTDTELINQVRDMEKSGIHVIGVGINFESIKEYYPDNANGRNLKEMVDIVVSILKRYVLEKKED